MVNLLRRPTQAPQESPFDRSNRLLAEKRNTLEVDKNSLDEEWVQHPQRLNEVGDEHALAVSYRDEAKSAMELATAQSDSDIRRLNTAKGEKAEKLTEGQIKAKVALDKRVTDATHTYGSWKLLTDQWSSLVRSFDSRQYALRNLVSLWEKGYFASYLGSGSRNDAEERVAASVRRQGTSL